MKTLWLVTISLILFSGTTYSQSNKAYCAQEITWFGLDYSAAYFTDDKAFPDPYKLRDKLFQEWTNLFSKNVKNLILEEHSTKLKLCTAQVS